MRPTLTLGDLIGCIYEPLTNSALWPEVLARIGGAFCSSVVGIIPHDFRDRSSSRWCVYSGFLPEYVASYCAHYSRANPWLYDETRYLNPGQSWRSEELLCHDELRRTEFFVDWLQPQNLAHGLFGVLRRDGGRMLFLAVLRSSNEGPYGEDETEFFEHLLPHVRRSVDIKRVLDDKQQSCAASLSALDRLSIGVILTDAQGRLSACNHRAREILRGADALTLFTSGLRSQRRFNTAALRSLIRNVADRIKAGSGVLNLLGPSGRRPLAIYVAPVNREDSLFGEARSDAVVFIGDPEKRHQPNPEFLQQWLALTPAEARLVAHLVAGEPLCEVADTLGIRVGTARCHLNRVFSKTGTSRQSELLALVAASSAAIVLDSEVKPAPTYSV